MSWLERSPVTRGRCALLACCARVDRAQRSCRKLDRIQRVHNARARVADAAPSGTELAAMQASAPLIGAFAME